MNLPHLASRLFGTPLMIARPKLEAILGVLAPRLAGNAIEPTEGPPEPAPLTAITTERIAVVSVIGTLVARSGYLDAASGLRSYSEIGEATRCRNDRHTLGRARAGRHHPELEIGQRRPKQRPLSTGRNGKRSTRVYRACFWGHVPSLFW